MIISDNKNKPTVFNLTDTNGRRSDVLNALKIYLEILEEIENEYPTETWSNYPESISQFVFYRKAIEKSSDVFKKHEKYDNFVAQLGNQMHSFIIKDKIWVKDNFPKFKSALDKDIEQRARHYSSNLVKIGFADSNRKISNVGYSYLNCNIERDPIEELLPLDNINMILLRQLAKLKIFSTPDKNGHRVYYSPFAMAMVLLLSDKNISKNTFSTIVQGLSPYTKNDIKKSIENNTIEIDKLEETIHDISIEVPSDISNISDIEVFKKRFKSSKDSKNTSDIYYEFFNTLKDFKSSRTPVTYANLLSCYEKNASYINKAFGYGNSVFKFGNKGSRYDLKTFLDKNSNHKLLTCTDLNREIYITYAKSKWIDVVREYSDTTIRMLGATGLFKFNPLPELSYKDVISLIFDITSLRKNVFGEMTKEEYENHEKEYMHCTSISQIFNYSSNDIDDIIKKIETKLNVTNAEEARVNLNEKKKVAFLNHVSEKYSKEKIIELLPLFSDRTNDSKIRNEVNESATVPTIYEFIIAICWYYISNKEFDLYNSLRLSLNADFEPSHHASGGDGDIIAVYNDIIIMLEVTLMNKQAQKRGEWEPVLRHSLNLKAANKDIETMTFFVADELDCNTINIWRAVSAVPLESTNSHQIVNGIVIMPFTNYDILGFLEKNVPYTEIISRVKESFANVPQLTDIKWKDDILACLID